jgi:hypothetical protein
MPGSGVVRPRQNKGQTMEYCARCEGLMLAAINASKAYHDCLADLESAHIRHDVEEPFGLKQQVAKALRNRDSAINALNDHEYTHKSRATG